MVLVGVQYLVLLILMGVIWENVEGVDSSNKDEVTVVDSAMTPTSKALGKMVVCELADQNSAVYIYIKLYHIILIC